MFNDCWGLTLDRVLLYLTLPVLPHGQLYTSMSRLRSAVHIRILRDSDSMDHNTPNVPPILVPHPPAFG
ncbi:uncharacterized protein ATNIH1004_001843 [Aspergillus tanneri]|uniref:Uncharacterized protein n=1 Tax=Aspergillus tanneri TaxID=1220188 RepID=A0A5M9N5T0_9EURO|nr:uncharacterized protein ATNIH1004_001843 [Aspergillus tanneri]KAA8652934.1 hypothetical protein ATNIH1004_001843 [Aspergillus tanneri]